MPGKLSSVPTAYCGSPVENIPLQAERHSGRRQKLFAFPTGIAFTFRPECCSESQRNRVRRQTGIAFTFDRIPQLRAPSASFQHRSVQDGLRRYIQSKVRRRRCRVVRATAAAQDRQSDKQSLMQIVLRDRFAELPGTSAIGDRGGIIAEQISPKDSQRLRNQFGIPGCIRILGSLTEGH